MKFNISLIHSFCRHVSDKKSGATEIWKKFYFNLNNIKRWSNEDSCLNQVDFFAKQIVDALLTSPKLRKSELELLVRKIHVFSHISFIVSDSAYLLSQN